MPLQPPSSQAPSFTVRYNGRANKLTTQTLISKPIDIIANPTVTPEIVSCAQKYTGIWDTGATNSVISQKVVDECNLKPISMAKVHTAAGETLCEVFLVSIFLPNKVVLPSVRVTKGILAECDVLIGMDIINQGDFAVTHNGGKTTFSFRLPSLTEIDFVQQKVAPVHSDKISRNAPCPCGSGKKYKRCCGQNA